MLLLQRCYLTRQEPMQMRVSGQCALPEAAFVIVDVNEVFAHHIELLQAVWVLRICDIPYVL